jgi:ABC-type multidrug transport system ATPase subunit
MRVTKSFGSRTVLNDVTLQVASGECVRITGTPKSGRTTLLRVIATLIRPTSGGLTVDGIDAVRDPVAARRRMVYVSPDTLTGTRLRVDEYLWFVGRARRRSISERHVSEACDRCGLARSSDVDRLPPPGRAALAVAGAVLVSADILLLDDVLAGVLDTAWRERLADALRGDRARGATMLVVSNGPDELSALSSRIVTLDRGHLHQGLSALRQPGEASWAH